MYLFILIPIIAFFIIAIAVTLVIITVVKNFKEDFTIDKTFASTQNGHPAWNSNLNSDWLHQMQHNDAMRMHNTAHNTAMHMHDMAHNTAINNHMDFMSINQMHHHM